jgi:hypothetical protein
MDCRPVVLCIVDRPGWAHDRKTDGLAATLAANYRVVKRYQADVTESDIRAADLVLLYYWLQLDRLAHVRHAIEQRRDRLLLGVCSEKELEHSWRAPALAILASLPRAVFANNWKLKRDLERTLNREIFYTPNGVDTAFFRSGAVTYSAPPLCVGWAGSLKNHTAAHRGVREFIVPAVDRVEGAALCLAQREERWRDASEMRTFYQSLHVYVCASRNEGTPNPCLEAAACGIPIVSTAVGNMPEFLRDGENGFLVERRVDDIARALRRLRDDPALRARMGSAARATAEAWDWSHQAPRYAELFDAVLSGRVGAE